MWDRAQISEGIALLTAALSKGSIGAYQLQAAIAAVHDEAARAEDTDWPQILALYELLRRMSDNPMVVLNHAIAAAMVHGPHEGLDLLHGAGRGCAPCRAIIAWMRFARICWKWRETPKLQSRTIDVRPSATTSIPERNYLLTQAARLNEARRPDLGDHGLCGSKGREGDS